MSSYLKASGNAYRGPRKQEDDDDDLPSQCEKAKAFGLGSQARIDGRPSTANPYAPGSALWSEFLWGYGDAAENWGLDARWPFRKLPPVSDETEVDCRE